MKECEKNKKHVSGEMFSGKRSPKLKKRFTKAAQNINIQSLESNFLKQISYLVLKRSEFTREIKMVRSLAQGTPPQK